MSADVDRAAPAGRIPGFRAAARYATLGAAILCAAVAGTGPGPAKAADATGIVHSAHVPAGYTLDWNDEFDGPLDPAKWAHFLSGRARGWTRLAREAVSNEPPGVLVLSAFMQDETPVTAWLTTQSSYRRAYGYFEARIRTQSTRGLRGAFWLMSAALGRRDPDPRRVGAEIDVLSYAGNAEGDRALAQGVFWGPYEGTPTMTTNALGQTRPLTNAPAQRVSGAHIDLAAAGLTNAPLSADYHVFGLRWTPRDYVFTLDGRETFRTSRGIVAAPHFLCLSLLPPPGERERPARVDLPATMRVDYVRVYAPPVDVPVAAPPDPKRTVE